MNALNVCFEYKLFEERMNTAGPEKTQQHFVSSGQFTFRNRNIHFFDSQPKNFGVKFFETASVQCMFEES